MSDYGIQKEAGAAFGDLVTKGLDTFQKINTEYEYSKAIGAYQNASLAFTKTLADPSDPDYNADPTTWLDRYQSFHEDLFNKLNEKFLSTDAQSAFQTEFMKSYSAGAQQLIVAAGKQQEQNYSDQLNDMATTAGITGDMSGLLANKEGMTRMWGKQAGEAKYNGLVRGATAQILTNQYVKMLSNAQPSEINAMTLTMENRLRNSGTLVYDQGQVYIGWNKDHTAMVGLTDNVDPSSISYFKPEDMGEMSPTGVPISLTSAEIQQITQGIQQKANDNATNHARIDAQTSDNDFPSFLDSIGHLVYGDKGDAGTMAADIAAYNSSHPNAPVTFAGASRWYANKEAPKDPLAVLLDPKVVALSQEVELASQGKVAPQDMINRVKNLQAPPGSSPQLQAQYRSKGLELLSKITPVRERQDDIGGAWRTADSYAQTYQKVMDNLLAQPGESNKKSASEVMASPDYQAALKAWQAADAIKQMPPADATYYTGPYKTDGVYDPAKVGAAMKSGLNDLLKRFGNGMPGQKGIAPSTATGVPQVNAETGKALWSGFNTALGNKGLTPGDSRTALAFGAISATSEKYKVLPTEDPQSAETMASMLHGISFISGAYTGLLTIPQVPGSHEYARNSAPGYSITDIQPAAKTAFFRQGGDLSPLSPVYTIKTPRGIGYVVSDLANANDGTGRVRFVYPAQGGRPMSLGSWIDVNDAATYMGKVKGSPSPADKFGYITANVPVFQ